MAKNKPYEVALEPHLASEILSIPAPPKDRTVYPETIGGSLQAAIDAVNEANEFLQNSTLAKIVADNLMRQLRKRGTPTIRVRSDGTVILHVAYPDEAEAPETKEVPPVQRAARSSDLPKLDELREWAGRVQVDISDLGRARRAIYERLVEAAGTTVPPTKPLLRKKPKEPKDDAGDAVRGLFAVGEGA